MAKKRGKAKVVSKKRDNRSLIWAVIIIIIIVVIAFSLNSITGNALLSNPICIDSDDMEGIFHPSEESFYTKGIVRGKYIDFVDKCRGREHQLREYFCTIDDKGNPKVKSWVEICKNGCIQEEGVCAR